MPVRSRTASTARPMAVAIGVALPLCMSLYTQQQDRQAQQRQQAQAEQAHSQAAAERDRSTAAALSARLSEARGSALDDTPRHCELLGQEAQLAGSGAYGPYTVGVLVAGFALHAAAADGAGQPQACLCQAQAQSLYVSLQPRASRLSRSLARRDLAPLQRQLGDALDECTGAAAVEISPTVSNGRSGGAARLGTAAPVEPAGAAGLGTQAAALTPELRPRLYLQLPAVADASLYCLRDALRGQGFVVPDFDVVGARAPAVTQLRYVDAVAQAAALQLLQTLRGLQAQCGAAGSQLARAVLPATPADYSRLRGNARPNHFELWLGADDAPAAPGN